MTGGRRLAGGLLLVASAAVAVILLFRASDRPRPPSDAARKAPRVDSLVTRGEVVGPVVPADSLNTPPSLLAGLFAPTAVDPARDVTARNLPIPPVDTARVAPLVKPSAPPVDTALSPPPVGAGGAGGGSAASEVAGGGETALAPLQPPIVLKAAWLQYPAAARKKKLEGDVEVRILVDALGGVASVALEKGASDTSLDSAALAAAQTMRFRPAMQGSEPVAVWFNYRFSFRLPP